MDLPTLDDLNKIDLNYISRNSFAEQKWIDFVHEPAPNYYKLLAWFSKQYHDKTLLEIGTYQGLSAAALAYNNLNKVISFDVENTNTIIWWPNLKFVIGDIFKYPNYIIQSSFIFFDTNHDGIMEDKFHHWLIKLRYEGVVMYDDIYLNDEMKKFWSNIKLEKHDLTDIGHWSGTGLVVYS